MWSLKVLSSVGRLSCRKEESSTGRDANVQTGLKSSRYDRRGSLQEDSHNSLVRPTETGSLWPWHTRQKAGQCFMRQIIVSLRLRRSELQHCNERWTPESTSSFTDEESFWWWYLARLSRAWGHGRAVGSRLEVVNSGGRPTMIHGKRPTFSHWPSQQSANSYRRWGHYWNGFLEVGEIFPEVKGRGQYFLSSSYYLFYYNSNNNNCSCSCNCSCYNCCGNCCNCKCNYNRPNYKLTVVGRPGEGYALRSDHK